MKHICDAVVVGSGIIGASISYALTRAGMRRVSLIEKGPLVSGMTRRNAGLAHPFHKHPLVTALAQASYPFYRQWTTNLGKSKSAFVETGAAVIAHNKELSKIDAPHSTANSEATDAMQLDGDALTAMFPGLEHFESALYTPFGGYADAVQTAQQMVNVAKERGMELYTGTQVKQITFERGRVRGAVTTGDTFETPAVIVAAGGWTERLLSPMGISLRLQYRRGVVVFYEQPRELRQGHPILLDASGSYFLRPHPYHMSAAGCIHTSPQPGGIESLDETVAPMEASDVSRFAQQCIPAFAGTTLKRSHSIMYDCPADGLPALGKVKGMDGLYIAAGFATSAFAVAPGVGETIAQLVIDGSSAHDISPFDPLR